MTRRARPAAALAVAAIGMAALLAGRASAARPELGALGFQPYEPPRPAPGFTLPDLDGRPRSLAELRGKVALLFFWATW
jgi:cytochrome oxidase Cu insertion factor (SCO1/SenC/PrrC family)